MPPTTIPGTDSTDLVHFTRNYITNNYNHGPTQWVVVLMLVVILVSVVVVGLAVHRAPKPS